MTAHPNRSSRPDLPGRCPHRADIRTARDATGLTQTEAAHLVYCTLSAWQRWEAGDRQMHPAFWELFQWKIGHFATDREKGIA